MNKAIKAKWVKALRSGKYERGAGFLKSDNKFCCLGVLVDITHPRSKFLGDREAKFLGEKYRKEFEILDVDQRDLAAMNDDGYSFKALAKYIEENL